ncbi:MAG TPA: hypothetical protein VGZ22_00155 [Isosphaeraceae bacterium]|jgi:hypothetical protein|nr:hypothetical protein [Isosphaeraceae bacterium]
MNNTKILSKPGTFTIRQWMLAVVVLAVFSAAVFQVENMWVLLLALIVYLYVAIWLLLIGLPNLYLALFPGRRTAREADADAAPFFIASDPFDEIVYLDEHVDQSDCSDIHFPADAAQGAPTSAQAEVSAGSAGATSPSARED